LTVSLGASLLCKLVDGRDVGASLGILLLVNERDVDLSLGVLPFAVEREVVVSLVVLPFADERDVGVSLGVLPFVRLAIRLAERSARNKSTSRPSILRRDGCRVLRDGCPASASV
jgi:hypothetical protein